MSIDVTSFVNDIVSLNPNVSASVKKGISTSTAVFASLESGQVDASTILNNENLPANVRANINSFLGSNPLNTASNFLSNTIGNVSASIGQAFKKTNSNTGITEAKKQSFDQGAPKSILDEADAPSGIPLRKIKPEIPTLLQSEVRALMLQLAYISSNYNTQYDTAPRYGRYAVHTQTLTNYGYIFKANGAWTGKDGINGVVDFCFDNVIQDKIMEQYITDQYSALIRVDAIRNDDTKENIAGMLAVSYQFQDATPSIGTAASGILTSIQEQTSDLTSQLSSTLSSVTSSLNQSLSAAENSGIMSSGADSLLGTLQNSNLTNSLTSAAGSMSGSLESAVTKGSLSDLKAIGDNLKQTAISSSEMQTVAADFKNKAATLAPSLTSTIDQTKIKAVAADVSKLRTSASSLTSAIPASKAKEWRSTGKENDTLGRSGSLFFNAGRYALTILSAD